MNNVLKGKTAFITGASRGIGKAIVHALARKGMKVSICGRSLERVEALAEDIKPHADAVTVNQVDLTNEEQLQQAIKKTRQELGSIELLVNCAGVFTRGDILDLSVEEWDSCIELNLRVPFLLCKEVIPDMITAGWGRIINIGSTSSYDGFAGSGAYCASKHALLGLSRTLYNELSSKNIRVHIVSPGTVDTEMIKDLNVHNPATLISPDVVADMVALLASQSGRGILGEVKINRFQGLPFPRDDSD
jgi:3-oxoacyl-[acyl-carrier protein] reductase